MNSAILSHFLLFSLKSHRFPVCWCRITEGFLGFLIKSWNLHPNHRQRTNHLNHRGVRDFQGWLATLDALLTEIYITLKIQSKYDRFQHKSGTARSSLLSAGRSILGRYAKASSHVINQNSPKSYRGVLIIACLRLIYQFILIN